ncbi:hypothetical protein H5410_052582, partial [Solanum commersonii]
VSSTSLMGDRIVVPLEDIVITYLHSCGEKQKTAPFKINDQLSLSTDLEDEPRGVLRIYMAERLAENHN